VPLEYQNSGVCRPGNIRHKVKWTGDYIKTYLESVRSAIVKTIVGKKRSLTGRSQKQIADAEKEATMEQANRRR